MPTSIYDYHFAPLQNARGDGPFFGLCGRSVAFFYTELEDFVVMPVKRCPECEGLTEAGFVLLISFGLQAALEFFAPGPRAVRRAPRRPVHPV